MGQWKYNGRPKIRVPCHNGHAWISIPLDPPKFLSVRLLDVDSEHALSSLSESREKRTTAAQTTMDQKTREVLVAFAARYIPPTTRVWLCGQAALVGSDETLWRTKAASAAIGEAFQLETHCPPDCEDMS